MKETLLPYYSTLQIYLVSSFGKQNKKRAPTTRMQILQKNKNGSEIKKKKKKKRKGENNQKKKKNRLLAEQTTCRVRVVKIRYEVKYHFTFSTLTVVLITQLFFIHSLVNKVSDYTK